MKRRFLILLLSIWCSFPFYAQESDEILSFEEFLGYVKQFHPFVKQADLMISEGEATLLKARGAFDPKLEVDFDRKEFKGTEYYDKLNTTFKIPTWFGVELKGNFQNNSGEYLNPENVVPDQGLYSMGVSIPLAKGLLTNKRMAMLKRAKLYNRQVEAERQLVVNRILSEASMAYFNWLKAFKKQEVYQTFLDNASIRLSGIKKNFELGETPAIDTLEAGIILKNRILSLEKARITYIKSTLELSNYLWLEGNIPVELQDNMRPDVMTLAIVDEVLTPTMVDLNGEVFEAHPKIKSLQIKAEGLDVERRLKLNNLLPEINFEYNFLTETPDYASSYTTDNYKTGLSVRFPIFLRKERGDLKMAKLKIQSTEFELASTRVSLLNKFDAIQNEIVSYESQLGVINSIVNNYSVLLTAEERKFDLGESSLFLINSRESKLIEARLKAIEIENESFKVKTNLFELTNFVG